MIKVSGDLTDLSHGVVDESTPFASVVKSQSCGETKKTTIIPETLLNIY